MKWIKLAGFTAVFALTVSLANAASVEWASGDVQANGQPLTAGMSIADSATVKAGANGRAKINLSNGSSVVIQPGQEVSLSAAAGGQRVGRLVRSGSRMENSNVSTVHGVRAASHLEKASMPDLAAATPEEKKAVETATAQVEAGKIGDAISTLEAVVKANNFARYAQAHLGMILFNAGDYASAIPHLTVAVNEKVKVDLPTASWMLMASQNATGQYEASNKTAEDTISAYAAHSAVPTWNLLRAENYIALGNKEAALTAIAEVRRTAMSQVTEQTISLIKEPENKGKTLNTILAGNETMTTLFTGHKDVLNMANELAKTLK